MLLYSLIPCWYEMHWNVMILQDVHLFILLMASWGVLVCIYIWLKIRFSSKNMMILGRMNSEFSIDRSARKHFYSHSRISLFHWNLRMNHYVLYILLVTEEFSILRNFLYNPFRFHSFNLSSCLADEWWDTIPMWLKRRLRHSRMHLRKTHSFSRKPLHRAYLRRRSIVAWSTKVVYNVVTWNGNDEIRFYPGRTWEQNYVRCEWIDWGECILNWLSVIEMLMHLYCSWTLEIFWIVEEVF